VQGGKIVADKSALEFLGLMFAAATAIVTLIAVVSVRAHMDGVAMFADVRDMAAFSAPAQAR
jgi:hypothetical protein